MADLKYTCNVQELHQAVPGFIGDGLPTTYTLPFILKADGTECDGSYQSLS